GYVYFRNVGERVLIGGGRNLDTEGETTTDFGSNNNIEKYLLNILSTHILTDCDFEIEYQWSGIMGFNKSKLPRVERLPTGIHVAIGLGGMGVALGSLVGRQVADLLLQS
ncbi:MAG: FAD-dependent oxidoreductase, partial [Bacteroidia bacterium]|nr:FAD-dependent oxidoreductase [Bacteroidia bacterium]